MLVTVVADVINPNGTLGRLVGSSRRTLNPAQRAALQPGEIPVAGSGHAEIKVLTAAKLRRQVVKTIASTGLVCAECRKAIETAGARITEQVTYEQ